MRLCHSDDVIAEAYVSFEEYTVGNIGSFDVPRIEAYKKYLKSSSQNVRAKPEQMRAP